MTRRLLNTKAEMVHDVVRMEPRDYAAARRAIIAATVMASIIAIAIAVPARPGLCQVNPPAGDNVVVLGARS